MASRQFISDFRGTPQISLGFQWYAINLSEFIQVVVVAKKESQPAVQAASCAAASRLCRHSAQTHTPYNASVLSRVSFSRFTRMARFCIFLDSNSMIFRVTLVYCKNDPGSRIRFCAHARSRQSVAVLEEVVPVTHFSHFLKSLITNLHVDAHSLFYLLYITTV